MAEPARSGEQRQVADRQKKTCEAQTAPAGLDGRDGQIGS